MFFSPLFFISFHLFYSILGGSTSKVTSADVSAYLIAIYIFDRCYPFSIYLTYQNMSLFISLRMQRGNPQEVHRNNHWQVHWNGREQSWDCGEQKLMFSSVKAELHLRSDTDCELDLQHNLFINSSTLWFESDLVLLSCFYGSCPVRR